MKIDYQQVNQDLSGKPPADIIRWALALPHAKPLLTTHFGPYEAAILHAAAQVKQDIEVLWVDSGYNTEETYRFVHRMIRDFKLNLHVYTPRVTAAYRNVNLGGIPLLEDELEHHAFTEEVKLEPFARGLTDLKPNIWLTALRKEQTEHRATLDIVVAERVGIIKVSPFFSFTESQMNDYIAQYDLPNEKNYFDPTKVLDKRECGLHISPRRRQ